MATKRKPSVAKAAKPDITPSPPVQLLTLSEAQAGMVTEAMRVVGEAAAMLEERKIALNNLISMVRPEGANGFDPKTMTFFSVPQEAPKE